MTEKTSPDPEEWAVSMEARLLEAARAHAPVLGWTSRLVAAAAADCGLSTPEAELLIPNGARDLAALLSRRHDQRGLDRLSGVEPGALKIRERIRQGLAARLDAAMEDAPALRRWAGFLSLPPQMGLGLRLAWASADVIWRWAGDTATDENHYSKRALVAGILISALAVRLTSGEAAASVYLDARIANVMAFERWKAALPRGDLGARLVARLGRLRYGAP